MAGLEMTWRMRRAIYTPRIDRPDIDIKKDTEVPCDVFGCFQVSDGEDINPYFIVELESGRCTYVAPEDIRFVDKDVLA